MKERAKDMIDCDAELKKSVKVYWKENDLLMVDLSAAEGRNKILAAKVEKLENAESRIEEEKNKRGHAVEMKHLLL